MAELARRLGAFDATMIVMGGIIGSGIFINPYVVATFVRSWPLILGVWIAGGVISILGAFVYAELSAIRPEAGGQYAYLRDAFHPSVAFLYGWGLLLVIQSGGMAAVAITFASYTRALTGLAWPDWVTAAATLLILTVINCLGVRSGSNTQNLLMLLKLAAIVLLVGAGLFWSGTAEPPAPAAAPPPAGSLLAALAAAMTPVMFAYGGWQNASFISGELARPRRDLAVGMLAGIAGVVAVYVAVNVACLRVLGPEGLAATSTPASAVMQIVMGERGATLIAAGIAISTLGFLSHGMLTAPRVYYAMAADRMFFSSVARVHPVTRVPIVAIVLQGVAAMVIALSGTYEQILAYVVATDFLFIALTGMTLFIFRRRGESTPDGFRAPGHPVTTFIFTAACFVVVIGTVTQTAVNSLIGFAILLAGLPAFYWWRRQRSEER